MRLDSLRNKSARARGVSTLGIIGAFLFAIALSDAPRLHEYFHKLLGPDHECAVTLFVSGSCEHLAGITPAAIAPVATSTSIFVPKQIQSLAAGLEFSRLEHAPPFSA